MTDSSFYDAGAMDYLTEVRRFVPGYDEMVDATVNLVLLHKPRNLLSIGVGVGNLEATLLNRLPDLKLVGLEPEETMAARAREQLATYSERVEVLGQTIQGYRRTRKMGAAVSNLVLHNVPYRWKDNALRKIHDRLVDGAPFVWGDLIKYDDPLLQRYFVEQRRERALELGAKPAFVEANFRKEMEEDAMLTTDDMVLMARQAGFKNPPVVWQRSTGAVLHMVR